MPLRYNPFTRTFDYIRKKLNGVTQEDLSFAPPGCRKVKNLYVNELGKTVVEFKDEPEK